MRNIGSTHIWALLATLAGCQRAAPPRVKAPSVDRSSPTAGERGMNVEAPPFTLEVTPRLRGSKEIVLKNGDDVVSRDTIKVEAKTSVDTHLYLGYCDKDHKLTIFPREGSIEAKAGQTTYAPNKDADLKLDDQPGSEVLYVIASRRRLDFADPDLAEAISKVRPGADSLECAPLNQALEKKKPPKLAILSGPLKGLLKPPVPEPSEPERNLADLERGGYIGYIRWHDTGGVSAGSDRDGIVVLRYTLKHVDKPDDRDRHLYTPIHEYYEDLCEQWHRWDFGQFSCDDHDPGTFIMPGCIHFRHKGPFFCP